MKNILLLFLSVILLNACKSNKDPDEHIANLAIEANSIYQDQSDLPTHLEEISLFGYVILNHYEDMLANVSEKDLGKLLKKYPKIKGDLQNRNVNSIFYTEPSFLLVAALIEKDSKGTYEIWPGHQEDIEYIYRAMNKPLPTELIF